LAVVVTWRRQEQATLAVWHQIMAGKAEARSSIYLSVVSSFRELLTKKHLGKNSNPVGNILIVNVLHHAGRDSRCSDIEDFL